MCRWRSAASHARRSGGAEALRAPAGLGRPTMFLWVSCCLTRPSRISPEFHRYFSSEFRQNIESEHLKQGDNHDSAFPPSAAPFSTPRARPGRFFLLSCCLFVVYCLVVCVCLCWFMFYVYCCMLYVFMCCFMLYFSMCACHPCAGAILVFSVSFQF